MGIFSFGMFKSRRAARPTTAVPTPTPTPKPGDLQVGADREFENLKRAASEAFVAQLKRDGYVWPSDKPSLEFEDLREQLRAARGRSRFS